MQYLTENGYLLQLFLKTILSNHSKFKIIQNLDSIKVHSHDSISICMLKICVPAIFKSLAIILK